MSREEALDWLESAEIDLGEAKEAYRRGSYHLSVFLMHQSVEKALEAYIIACLRKRPPKTHDLVELANHTGLRPGEDIYEGLSELSPYYIISRYPNAGLRKPWKEISRGTSEKFMILGERILGIIKEKLTQDMCI